MFIELLMVALAVLALVVFVDIQRYMSDPQRKQKSEEWFEKFLEYNKETYRDPRLAWRYNVIEDSFAKPNR